MKCIIRFNHTDSSNIMFFGLNEFYTFDIHMFEKKEREIHSLCAPSNTYFIG